MSRNIHIPAPKYKVGYTLAEIEKIEKLIGVEKGDLWITANDLIAYKNIRVAASSALIREIRRVKNGKMETK